MRARDVSVGIQETPDGLIVLARFYVKSAPLEREGSLVKESARKLKEKEIAKLLEAVEYSE